MTDCFAYSRCSGKGQIDGDTFPRQRAAIEAHAAKNGYQIVQWFEEKGVCGATEWEDRPAWSEMVGNLNGVRTIIIERLDRLARDLGVQEYIIRDLRKREIELISTAEPDLGDSDPTRTLFRQIMGAVAQYDRAMIEAKLRVARKRKKEQTGRCEGRKPYGFRPGEPAILSKMKELRENGSTYVQIAATMNSAGIRTREGMIWIAPTIRKILHR